MLRYLTRFLSEWSIMNLLLVNKLCSKVALEFYKELFIEPFMTWEYAFNDNVLKIIKADTLTSRACFYGSCSAGHYDLAKLSLSKIHKFNYEFFINFDFALEFACYGNDINLVNMIIENGGNKWNEGLIGACRANNVSIVNMMIEYGASNFNKGLEISCRNKNKEIMKIMVENGADQCYLCDLEPYYHLIDDPSSTESDLDADILNTIDDMEI